MPELVLGRQMKSTIRQARAMEHCKHCAEVKTGDQQYLGFRSGPGHSAVELVGYRDLL